MAMQFTDKQIEQFLSIYEKSFGSVISTDEAIRSGTRLIQLLQLIYQPLGVRDQATSKSETSINH